MKTKKLTLGQVGRQDWQRRIAEMSDINIKNILSQAMPRAGKLKKFDVEALPLNKQVPDGKRFKIVAMTNDEKLAFAQAVLAIYAEATVELQPDGILYAKPRQAVAA